MSGVISLLLHMPSRRAWGPLAFYYNMVNLPRINTKYTTSFSGKTLLPLPLFRVLNFERPVKLAVVPAAFQSDVCYRVTEE